jgi:prepilin-type N-terminal cleavage/methylation domain-containing protein
MMEQKETARARRAAGSCERGYNLVEVLIAVAITGVVILGILSLFAIGRSNVHSGRQMTHAISVGTRALEDMSAMPMQELYDAFNITGTTSMGDVELTPEGLPDSEYEGSIMRTTKAIATAGQCSGTTLITFQNDPKTFLRRWYCQMQTAGSSLKNGQIWVVITPRKPIDAAQPLAPLNASVVRVRTVVRWSEGLRNRQLIFDTTKYNRPNPE